jgi:uncharacterized membrane protein
MTGRTGVLKKTILGGVVFLVPFVILLAVAGKAYAVMERFAAPIAQAIGIERIGAVAVINIVTVLAIVAVCYIAGLLATSKAGRRVYERIDERVVVFLPGSPDPWSGVVSLVTPDRVTPLQVDFTTAVRAMKLAGRGTLKIL